MASDPSKGVVDSTLKVYETNNLFVAGSSVFPTNSWGNPTFTIIALTIRLADHLKTLNKGSI
jgi:choline dehydrogenase-like flavoprotein